MDLKEEKTFEEVYIENDDEEKEEQDEEKTIRNRIIPRKEKERTSDSSTKIKRHEIKDFPCSPVCILLILFSGVMIIILLYIYAVYYLLMYKRDLDATEEYNLNFPYARSHINENDEKFMFKPPKFTSNEWSHQNEEYRLIIGLLWTNVVESIDNIERFIQYLTEEVEKVTDEDVLIVIEKNMNENDGDDQNYLLFKKNLLENLSSSSSKLSFFEIPSEFRFFDHFRDSPGVDYSDSSILLPSKKERQRTCDFISMFTHILSSFRSFRYFLLIDINSYLCGAPISISSTSTTKRNPYEPLSFQNSFLKIMNGLTKFEYDKEIDFCSLKFSVHPLFGSMFSRTDLRYLTSFLENNIDKYRIEQLFQDYMYTKVKGKYRYCQALKGRTVFTYKKNLFSTNIASDPSSSSSSSSSYKRGIVNVNKNDQKDIDSYPICGDSMVKYQYFGQELFNRRCRERLQDFSPCKGF